MVIALCLKAAAAKRSGFAGLSILLTVPTRLTTPEERQRGAIGYRFVLYMQV